MKWIKYFLGERGTFFQLEHSGSLNFMRFLYCFVTAITMALYSGEYDRRYLMAPYYPSPLFEHLPGPMPFAAYQTLRWVCVACLLFSAFGLMTRVNLVVAAISFFFYEGTQLGFTKPPDSDYSFHITNLTFFFLLVMAVAPHIDRHTLLTTLKKKNEPILIPEWPRKAMITMIAFAYFGAGYCRVLASPLWMDGHTLQGYMMDKATRWDIGIGLELSQHWLPCVILSIMTMALELGYPIVLAFPRFKPLMIVGGLMLHAGILTCMGINFFFFFAYNYFAFIEWPWLARVVLRLKTTGAEILKKTAAPHPLPRAYLVGFAVFAGIQATCVFGRIEAWPFSDFRVFQKRTKPEEICILYLAKPVAPGHESDPPEFLPFWDHYYTQRAMSWRPQRELVRADESEGETRQEHIDEARRLIYKALVSDDPKLPKVFEQYGGVRLFQKRPRLDSKTGRYNISLEYVMDLPAPNKVGATNSDGG